MKTLISLFSLLLLSFFLPGHLMAKKSTNSFVCPLNQLQFDDGDSFACKGEEIRVLGIDTPEIKHPQHGIFKDQRYGQKASAFTKKVFKNSKEILVVRGPKDPYGRTLAHVLVDGELLGVKLLKAGLAYESISKYGEQGFPQYSKEILTAAASGPKPKFENPHDWRKKNQKK